MKQYDLVIQLGSQVKFVDGRYYLPPHTKMRTEAASLVLKKGITPRLIISGGSNFGVRYDDREILKPQVFTFEAFANANFRRKTEAEVIKDALVNDFGLSPKRILTETLSATTKENAEFVKILLARRPMFSGNERIAVLTLLYHMEKALPVFWQAGLDVEPLFAESILANDNSLQIERVCQYYATPKGGRQYPVDRLRQMLTEGTSLIELMS